LRDNFILRPPKADGEADRRLILEVMQLIFKKYFLLLTQLFSLLIFTLSIFEAACHVFQGSLRRPGEIIQILIRLRRSQVGFKKILPIAILVIMGGIIASCKLDPWSTGEMPTDLVTITKTTKTFEKGKPEETIYKSKVGAVRMSHKVHEEKGLKCEQCHHKKNNPDREKKCAACHFGEEGYMTMHGLCLDCHIKRKEGPQKCKQCH
jgi:hypothetical protein